ncbi:hypothetical protein [Thaumasiovibrio subtropicus]|uniref:hypothetical protein n=1 Tax=Thaumasiovibrio subtropicus TaxID=1891207 RepID=UPI00131C9E62|nr:hypothetical protein [Thaumasiovibrio subtropicus]
MAVVGEDKIRFYDGTMKSFYRNRHDFGWSVLSKQGKTIELKYVEVGTYAYNGKIAARYYVVGGIVREFLNFIKTGRWEILANYAALEYDENLIEEKYAVALLLASSSLCTS